MKKVLNLLLAVIMAVTLTGCFGANMQIQMKSDGSGVMSYSYMIDSGVNKYIMSDPELKKELSGLTDFKQTKEMYDDCYYVCYTKEVPFSSPKELKKILTDSRTFNELFSPGSIEEDKEDTDKENEGLFSYVDIGADHLQAVYSSVNSSYQEIDDYNDYVNDNDFMDYQAMENSIFMRINITFDKEITYTNGSLSADKKTASWKIKLSEYYDTLLQASTSGKDVFAKDTKVPDIYPVKDGKYYPGYISILVTDNFGVKSVTCNGKKVPADYTVFKDGKYVIEAEDYFGNKAKKTFYIDMQSPKISGVKNGVIYKSERTIRFSDKYGIKSATLNGKTIKTGKKVSKNGKYKLVVKDRAGNTTRATFTIKKK
ncbi:MAG TPA: hypothetical protein DCW90_19485 [Lachnospiraceae bacterium]|nr:hypothetical protein [uncultured Lachnoclostridium sp.]HAU87587.1 hypothetical protein [Lachnospiraceae bacterium]